MRLLTPPGIAGIAIVRAAPHERARLATCLRSPQGSAVTCGAGAPPRRALLLLDGTVVDDVLVVDRGGLGIELHLHGSRAVLDALAGAFGFDAPSNRSAGERLLREALCATQLELAIEQIGADLDGFCRDLARLPSAQRAAQRDAARERSRIAMAQVLPARLVLVGAQNAGKSSLFNRLLFRERALTGQLPGLTRDPVAELAVLEGYPYEIVDTAGEGDAAAAVDAAAIARGRGLRLGALQLLVVDGGCGPSRADRELASTAALVVANKADLPPAAWAPDVPCHLQVSCTAENAVLVRARVGELLRHRRGLPPAGAVGGVAALSAEDLARLG